MKGLHPAIAIDPLELAAAPGEAVARLIDWARARVSNGPVLVYASAPPGSVAAIQARLGRDRAGQLIEEAMAAIAKGLAAAGVRRFVVAGGETSGAVVSALGIEAMEIGPQIAPGVPATLSYGTPRLALALKSGNFGGPDFFAKALAMLR